MKRKFTILTAALALLACLTIPLGMWGQTRANYTIGFQSTNGGDASQELTASTALTSLTEGSTTYITSFSNLSKVYKGKDGYGWKLGTGSAVGTFVMNLSNSGQVTATKITIKTAKYSSDSGKVKITLNGSSSLTYEITPQTDLTDTEWTLSSPTAINSIKIETTSKRAYVHSVKVSYGSSYNIAISPDEISVNYEQHNSGLGDDEFLSMNTNITDQNPNNYSVVYCDSEDGTYSNEVPSWMYAEVLNTGAFQVYWYIGENNSTIQNECYFKVKYGETESNAVHVTQTGNPNAPTITVNNNYSVNVGYEGEGSEELSLSYSGFVVNGAEDFAVQYYNAQGQPINSSWVDADVEEDSYNEGVYLVWLTVDPNEGDPRTTYFKVFALVDDDYVYSNLVTVNQAGKPYITLTPNTLNVNADEHEDNLAMAFMNMTTPYYITESDFTVAYFESYEDAVNDGDQVLCDWITVTSDLSNNQIDYQIEANTDEERTIYFWICYLSGSYGYVYSNIITVTQEAPAADYAELPFEWAGGPKADLLAMAGVTANGLGNGYGSTHNPYNVQFDNTGDYIQVKTDSQPGIVTIGVKMIGGANTSKITVKGSTDGETFDQGEELTISGAQNDILTLTSTRTFAENVRYVRLYFTKGSNVGVGPITIAKPSNDPFINIDPDLVEVNADMHDGTLDLSYAYLEISDMTDFDIQFYDAEENELNGNNVPDWIEVLVAEQDPQIGEGYVVSYTLNENEGEARTAYFKVFALGNNDYVYSNLVTISQALYVPEFASLPFAFDGGKADIETTGGLTQDGLDSDYSSSPYLKFNTTGDWLLLKFNEVPGTLTFDIKGNSFENGTFKVQTSVDGVTYTDLETYTDLDDTQSEEFGNLDENVRYIKWVYTQKVTGNVALGNIELTQPVIETITKTINADKWYLIASPVIQDVNPANAGLITYDANNISTYALYSFDQTQSEEWRNYKSGAFDLVSGMGYLYANQTGCTLTFTGTTSNKNSISCSLVCDEEADRIGYNLLGNPFNEDASVDMPFYRMNASGTEIEAASGDDPLVHPMEGIFVIATEDGQEITFQTGVGNNNGNDKIALNLSQNRGNVIDRAIVLMGEGRQLPKFQLFENSTKIYIPQNGKDYAVVRSEGQGELPVNFRAAENGTYTLSIDAENMDMNYLHLIDNMTGMDIDLLQTPSYTFEANVNDYESRFRLVFAANNEDGVSTGSTAFAFFSNGNWIINNAGEATLQVVDLTGRILSSETVNGSVSKTINAVPGVYMLRLINGDNVNVQKIVVR